MREQNTAGLFEFFNEIGIIEQLSRALLEARLPDGLIAPHFTVLNHLIRVGDGRAPIEMARAFQVPKTTLTHTLKGLDALGLIEMRPNPADGRSKLVYITKAGVHLRNDVIDSMGPEFQRLAQGFELSRLTEALPVLRDLRVFLDENRNDEPAS